MLSPEIIKKIKKIHIKSGHLVNSMMAGQYRSVFRGQGIEFEEVREYSPGDDVKSIDWKVSARFNRPYVKRYREERELVVMLLVDMSASGQFGTGELTKTEVAAEIASIIAFNAIRNNDKVGAILFTDRVEKYIPPKKGSSHVWRVIREFFTFDPENRGTDIEEAVAYLGRVCRKKTVSFLISDFLLPRLTEPVSGRLMKQLKITSKKHEFINVLLSDPGEFKLPHGGIITAEDPETGEIWRFDASDVRTRQEFTSKMNHYADGIVELMKASDVDCIRIGTMDSVADALTKYFRSREKRKR